MYLKIFEKTGAGSRIRTRDPLITNQMLYQLSYAGPVGLLVGDHNAKRRVAEVGNHGNLGRAPPHDFVEGDSGRC